MLTSQLLLMAAAPTLGHVLGLPPERAGKLVLNNAPHAVIISVELKKEYGIGLPDATDLELVERPRKVAGGCLRTRWTARFDGPGRPERRALRGLVFSNDEVALSAAQHCPSGQYVGVHNGMDYQGALELLHKLQDVLGASADAIFDCTSDIDLLCTSPDAMRSGLRASRAWAAVRVEGVPTLWLGTRGQAVTEVQFISAKPLTVKVRRKIPAPF